MKLRKLNPDDAWLYRSLIFPSMVDALERTGPDGPDIAIGALADDRPAGLVYCLIGPDRSAEIRCLTVTRPHRSKGIATALMRAMEAELKRLECPNVKLSYVKGRSTTAAFERVLEKCGWGPAADSTVICTVDERMINWSRYNLAVTDGFQKDAFELFDWKDLTSVDRAYILRSQAEAPWIPEDLVPFQYEENFEPLNSLGLRYCGLPAGWMITHRVAPDTIRYTCSFLRKDLQRRWRIGFIYREAYHRQYELGIPYALFMVPPQHTSMVNFVKRRWAGTCATVTETRSCSKALGVLTEVASAR